MCSSKTEEWKTKENLPKMCLERRNSKHRKTRSMWVSWVYRLKTKLHVYATNTFDPPNNWSEKLHVTSFNCIVLSSVIQSEGKSIGHELQLIECIFSPQSPRASAKLRFGVDVIFPMFCEASNSFPLEWLAAFLHSKRCMMSAKQRNGIPLKII